MMNDTCLTPATRAQCATALNATIKTYCATAIRPDKRLSGQHRPLMSKMCAQPETRPDRRDQVIRSLGMLGMDSASATTFLAMTEQLFASNTTTQDT